MNKLKKIVNNPIGAITKMKVLSTNSVAESESLTATHAAPINLD